MPVIVPLEVKEAVMTETHAAVQPGGNESPDPGRAESDVPGNRIHCPGLQRGSASFRRSSAGTFTTGPQHDGEPKVSKPLTSNSSNSTITTVRGSDERRSKMTIITHTREAGTLIEGTMKGDGSNAVLKA